MHGTASTPKRRACVHAPVSHNLKQNISLKFLTV